MICIDIGGHYKMMLKSYFTIPGFRFTFWYRVTGFLAKSSVIFRPLYFVSILIFRHYSFKYGIAIPSQTKICKGFYIGHFSSIIVSMDDVIGSNVNISQGVTIGASSRGKNMGAPKIGNNVYIGPGAKIFGNISIGDNVAIGANAVVNMSIPSNAVVGGIPAKILSLDGANGYVNRTV